MKYIVTKAPYTYIFQRITVEDSLDGVLYNTFEEALSACESLDGCGVTTVWE